jgi:NAD-dependent deacetylase
MNKIKKLVVITGAGISAESGIQTFRDGNGLWQNHKIEDVATPEAWRNNPELVQSFYNVRRKEILESKANEAHHFLSELENKFSVQIITQNIDDLHERGGSTNVLHLHGNIRFAKSSISVGTEKLYLINGSDLKMTDFCEDGHTLRPHVVWFGEAVPLFDEAISQVKNADILLVIGTSLNVYPAASLIDYVKPSCKCIIVDPKINSMNVRSQFMKIKKSAVDAISELKNILQ